MFIHNFISATDFILRERRLHGLALTFPADTKEPFSKKLDQCFAGKTEAKCGDRRMPWRRWLIEGVFPLTLYRANKSDLRRMLRDERLYEEPRYAAKDAWNSFFGRMARPRLPDFPEGFIPYLLERWGGNYRTMPQYYFSVEPSEWVYAPLVNRPDIPKTWRTSVSCVMNIAFHSHDDKADVHIILKHLQWSHMYGDILGGAWMLEAICKALNRSIQPHRVFLYAVSCTMDEPKIAKAILC